MWNAQATALIILKIFHMQNHMGSGKPCYTADQGNEDSHSKESETISESSESEDLL